MAEKYEGRPCKRCNNAIRYASNRMCVVCACNYQSKKEQAQGRENDAAVEP